MMLKENKIFTKSVRSDYFRLIPILDPFTYFAVQVVKVHHFCFS